MNNEIIISNVAPQDIVIGEGGATGITAVYVNGVDVTVGSIAYVIVPTKTSELINDSGFITSEQDPTVPYHVKQITTSDITRWNNKQDQLVSGQNIKTINNQSILGQGNLDVETVYTAGTGINITDEKVINNTITSYNDLTDLPTIPTSTSELTNDSDFVSSNALSSVAFTGDYEDLTNTPDLSEYITKYVSDLVNYYNKDFFYKILPKVSDSGTVVSLDDTIKGSQMYLTLGATELSQDGTPTPSTPYSIHTIKGNNTIKVFGANLLDTSTTSTVKNQTGDDRTGYYCKIPETGRYYLMLNTTNTMYYGKSTNLSSATTLIGSTTPTYTSNYDFTAGEYFIIWGTKTDSDKLMVIKSSSPVDYQPYTSQEQDVDLEDIEYCKIGTYEDVFFKNVESSPYYDENLDEDTWYLKKNIGKITLNGSENITSYGTSVADHYRYAINVSDILRPSSSGDMPSIVSDHYQAQILGTAGSWGAHQGISIDTGSSSIFINDDTYYTQDSAAYKTWLSTNNVICYYALTTPTYTPITGTLAEQLELIYNSLTSEQDQTNISQVNNDLPFTISATTLKDLSSL